MSRIALTIIIASALLSAGVAHAKQTPEQKCQKGRYDAAAKYAACQQKAMGAFYGVGKVDKFNTDPFQRERFWLTMNRCESCGQ
jgi:hypothetical protein